MPQEMSATLQSTQRFFAEFPFSRTWLEVGQHVAQLVGARVTGFFNYAGEPNLEFTYKQHNFCIRERGDWLEFFVREGDDLDPTLLHVHSHFAPFLSPGICD